MKNNDQQSNLAFPKWLYTFLKSFFPKFFKDSLPRWYVWKTIEIGNYENIEALEKAINLSGAYIDPFVKPLLYNFDLKKKATTIDLVQVTPLSLGFGEHTQYHKIIQAGLLLGLKLCPAEVGPILLILNSDFTQSEDIYIAMEPITLTSEIFESFALQNRKPQDNSTKGKFLIGVATMPVVNQSFFPINSKFIFVKE